MITSKPEMTIKDAIQFLEDCGGEVTDCTKAPYRYQDDDGTDVQLTAESLIQLAKNYKETQ